MNLEKFVYSGPENFKKSGTEKLVKSNKSTSQNKFVIDTFALKTSLDLTARMISFVHYIAQFTTKSNMGEKKKKLVKVKRYKKLAFGHQIVKFVESRHECIIFHKIHSQNVESITKNT